MNLGTISQKHPHWTAMQERWLRYRQFYEGIDVVATKQKWLPKGAQEWTEDYVMRTRLTQHLGWSQPAVERIAGNLTKSPAELIWPEDSKTEQDIKDQITAFRKNADGNGRDIDSWWGDLEPEALALGIAFVEIAKPPSLATSGADETLPYLSTWTAEELINWSTDIRGALEWVVLSRHVSTQATWDAPREDRAIFRVLTRQGGAQFEAPMVLGMALAGDAQLIQTANWTHGLNIVPLVPVYAKRLGPMMGASYIDGISKADWRILQLESDQSHASYLHGSPTLVVWTDLDLKTVGVGASQVLRLNPGGTGDSREDAKYLTVDTGGMEIREAVIERTARQALNAAGIDPNAVIQGNTSSGGVRAASGVSLAWSFSTAEGPKLASFTEEMDAADYGILEVVTRFLNPVGTQMPEPHERLFDGQITRAKRWDMLDAATTVDLTMSAEPLVKSETARKAMAKDVIRKILPNLDPDQAATINEEIDDADYSVQEAPDMGPTEPEAEDEAEAESEDEAASSAQVSLPPKREGR